MTRMFDRDLDVKVYGEFSKLSSNDRYEKLRLNPLSSVKRVVDGDRPRLVVLKPLVETQNSLKLLDYFAGSKALWMYRHYKDVASSSLKRFGIKNGIDDLRPIVENSPENWRSENVSEGIREIVLEHFSENMNPYDAAALFWFARNSLFFKLNLDTNPDVIMCKYEELVTNPRKIVQGIYGFVGQSFPGENIVAESHRESLQKGKSITLSPEVDLLCKELLEKLDRVYQTNNYYTGADEHIRVKLK